MIKPIEPGEHSYLKSINHEIVNWNSAKSVKPSELAHLEMLNDFQHKHENCNFMVFGDDEFITKRISDKHRKNEREKIKTAMSNSVSGKRCPRKCGNYSGTLNY